MAVLGADSQITQPGVPEEVGQDSPGDAGSHEGTPASKGGAFPSFSGGDTMSRVVSAVPREVEIVASYTYWTWRRDPES